MSANVEFVEFITDQLRAMGLLQHGRFFGGHAFKYDGAQFAMIMGNVLYLRVDANSVKSFESSGSEPFSYETKRGRVFVRSYYTTPAEVMDDQETLLAWANRALDAARAGKKPK